MAGLLNRMVELSGRHPEASSATPTPIIGGSITEALEGNLRAFDATPDKEEGRNETYTHVSSLVRGICPRAFSLQMQYGGSPEPQLQSGMRMIWAMGRAVEKHIRTALVAQTPDRIYGMWACRCGKARREGTGIDEAGLECEVCGTGLYLYREKTFFCDEYEVAGNPDFLYKEGDGFWVVEIKSTNAKGFDKRVADNQPDTDHALQAGYYVRMGQRKGMNMLGAIVLYGLKDFKWGANPYKSFVVDMRKISAGLNLMDDRALRMKEAREALRNKGKLPRRQITCPDSRSPMAKSCSVCSLCFSLSDK